MKNTPLYTIGHGRREIREFVDLLLINGIQYLVDVRSVPFSRFNPQYNQKSLATSLEKSGIRYVFMGDQLGGRPKDQTCYVNGKVSYELLAKKDFYLQGIERLKTAYNNQNLLAVMCSESDPEKCHRTNLIAKSLHTQNIPVLHIDEKGNIRSNDDLRKAP